MTASFGHPEAGFAEGSVMKKNRISDTEVTL